MKLLYFLMLGTIFINCKSTNKEQQDLPADPIPVHDTFAVDSKLVGEVRNINVWTPPNYKEGKDSLPVMYMADGGIVEEDFPHIANTLADLIMAKRIPPMILIGIANTQRRRDLSGPTVIAADKEIAPVVGGSEKFRAFINEELFPEVNKRYRTTSQRSIIGESLSGLFVMETFLLTPNMFDNYIAFDPSFWWNDSYLVKTSKQHLSKYPNTNKRVWFASSSAEDIAKQTQEFATVLQTLNLPNLAWKFSPEPKEQHNTIFRATKEKAIVWTFGSETK
jgi:uncharacterized protein